MPEAFRGRIAMFEYQPPATLDQPAPVANTWYDILPPTAYVGVYIIAVNIEDTDETLEVQIIINGETIQPFSVAATHSTDYFARLDASAINRVDQIDLDVWAAREHGKGILVEGHSVQVQVRKTTANGVGNLTGIVMYGVLRDVV